MLNVFILKNYSTDCWKLPTWWQHSIFFPLSCEAEAQYIWAFGRSRLNNFYHKYLIIPENMSRWIHRQKNLHIAENPASFSLLFYWQFDADCEKEACHIATVTFTQILHRIICLSVKSHNFMLSFFISIFHSAHSKCVVICTLSSAVDDVESCLDTGFRGTCI